MTASASKVEKVRGWLTGRLPDEWFTGPVEVVVDREEITIVGQLAKPDVAPEASEAERAAAISGRIKQFREDTREHRIEIASELEHRSDRKVAWGVDCGDRRQMFTTLSAPVMTRLRQPERQVLDTLVDAGVARSRSHALAWCVRLVGENADTWLGELRQALSRVDEIREAGPGSRETASG
jgi:hypothetical protein